MTVEMADTNKDVYVAVLHKLHDIIMHGFFTMEEGGRYVFTWDEKKSVAQNKALVAEEDAVLSYFLGIGVVDGERVYNEFRRQHMQGQEQTPPSNVWTDWNDVDSAYREYEWATFLYGANNDKFEHELRKFGLMNAGLVLVAVDQPAKVAESISQFGLFAAYKDGSVSYNNTLLRLKPTVRLLVYALVQKKGAILRYHEIVDTLWNEENGTDSYLEDPKHNQRAIKKRIGNTVSEANEALRMLRNKKHIVSVGETSYKLVS